MTPADALSALREALAAGTAHDMTTLRGWVRLAGQRAPVRADVRLDLTTGEAVVQQLDIAAPPGSDAVVAAQETL